MTRSRLSAPPLAWSEAVDVPELVMPRRIRPGRPVAVAPDPFPPARRRPLLVAVAALVVIVAGGGVTALALHTDSHATPEPVIGTAHRTVIAVPAPG